MKQHSKDIFRGFKKKKKKSRIFKSLAHFEVWSSSQSELMPFFLFYCLQWSYTVFE